MKTSIVLFAGAMFASSMLAAGTHSMDCAKHTCCRPAGQKAAADPGAEERFRIKFGRNTQAEQARQNKAAQVYAMNMMHCVGKTVVAKPTTVATADPSAQVRFRMKFGRTAGAQEQPVVLASADRDMCGAGCCTH